MRSGLTCGSSHWSTKREEGGMRVRARLVAAALALTAGAAGTVALAGLPVGTPAAPEPLVASEVAADVAVPAPLAASRSRQPAVAPRVAPLKTLRVPDLLVTVRGSLTPAQLKELRAIRG